jgi:NADH-quinone oxidoreductase subunit H
MAADLKLQLYVLASGFPWLAPVWVLGFVLSLVLICFYADRKVSAFMQDRMGPTERGPYGIFQPVADLIKLLGKGEAKIAGSDDILYKAAPLVLFGAVFIGFAVVPIPGLWVGATGSAGLLFLLAAVSLDAVGVWMAGWGSFSKFSLLGALRGVAQLISYEVPLGLAVLAVVVWNGTLTISEIASAQSGLSTEAVPLLGLHALGDGRTLGGIFCWNIVQAPWLVVSLGVFYIASLAECNRAPFDLPEGESELVAGFHTEYSGFRFALFFLAEYALMVLVCLLTSYLFLGGGNSPLPNIGSWKLGDSTSSNDLWLLFWLSGKLLILLFTHVWLRWTLPRLRGDQLMKLGWKQLTPVALGALLVTIVMKAVLLTT